MGIATKFFKLYFHQLYQFKKGVYMTWMCLWDLYCKNMKKKENDPAPAEVLKDWPVIFIYGIFT